MKFTPVTAFASTIDTSAISAVSPFPCSNDKNGGSASSESIVLRDARTVEIRWVWIRNLVQR